MKHIRLFASFFALMMLLCAGASAEITITKRDINMNTALDKNVSNILVLLQDGGETDTMMIASINSRTGRSVMLRVNCDLTVDVPENGETRLADVYALGAKKSRGLVAERAVNTLLGLNIGTYVALDVSSLPELVDAVDTVSMELTDAGGGRDGAGSRLERPDRRRGADLCAPEARRGRPGAQPRL